MTKVSDRADEALRHALDGTAVLFVGSGVGFLATAQNDLKLPNGRALADLLHKKVEMEPGRHSLSRISQYVKNKVGPAELLLFLKGHLTVVDVDERLKKIYRCPWQRIYTTNYDNAIEHSRIGSAIVSPFTLNSDPMTAPRGSIVHLNGYMDAITPNSFDNDAVLTDLSYSINEFQDSDWSKQFLIDVKTARSLIFLGYSMSDLDIVRLLIADSEISNKTVIYVSPDADEVEIDALSSYGMVRTGGFDELYDQYQIIEKNHVPAKAALFTELRKIEVVASNFSIAPAQKVYRQLVYGKVAEQEFLFNDQPVEGVSYLGSRRQLKDAIDLINSGAARDLFIHGEFASGKSCACMLSAKAFY